MIFDAHGDILTDIYIELKKGNTHPFFHRHLELYKKGGISHSIFVNFTHPKTDNPHLFNEIFDKSIPYLQEHSDLFTICTSYNDLEKSSQNNTIGVILGMEGIKYLKDVNHLRKLYQLGVRHASLTWNEVNEYGAGLDNINTLGITDKGKEILAEMQRLGMIVDLAHSNEILFDDIIQNTTGPIIILNCNTKALCDHKRNYTDEQMKKVSERGGVLGICAIAPFLSHDTRGQTVVQMAKHIDHAVKVMGINHVGLGFDFCYYLFDGVEDNRVDGLKTIGDIGNLFVELQKMGYTKEEITKIKYDNFFRVFKEVLQ